MTNRIVCGVDLSAPATASSRGGAALAVALGVPLELVHVVEGDTSAAVAQATRAALSMEVTALRDRWPDVELTSVVDHGDPDEVLVARAGTDALLVVGAVGRRGPARWLVGSTAERVAQAAKVPVVVVRDPTVLEAWARGGPLAVAVGIDPSRTSRAAWTWAAALARARRGRFVLLHVANPLWEAVRLGLAAGPHDRLTPEAEDLLRRDLLSWSGEGAAAPHELRLLVGREPPEAQLAAAARAGVDLLVVGTHQRAAIARLWQASVSRGVLALAPGNVALVPLAAVPLARPGAHAPRRVMVPVDFCEASARGVAAACAAVGEGGTVHLLHVSNPGDPTADDATIRARLAALVPSSALERRVTTVLEVVHARDVADTVWHAVERTGADLVCMPSRSRVAGFGPSGPGSIATALVARAACPVLLVPPTME